MFCDFVHRIVRTSSFVSKSFQIQTDLSLVCCLSFWLFSQALMEIRSLTQFHTSICSLAERLTAKRPALTDPFADQVDCNLKIIADSYDVSERSLEVKFEKSREHVYQKVVNIKINIEFLTDGIQQLTDRMKKKSYTTRLRCKKSSKKSVGSTYGAVSPFISHIYAYLYSEKRSVEVDLERFWSFAVE